MGTPIPQHAQTAEFDAVFIVADDAGQKHYVFALVTDDGNWSQWGAPREVLGRNVPMVTAWATAVTAERACCADEAVTTDKVADEILAALSPADLTNLRTACFTSTMRSDPAWAASLDALAEKFADIRDAVVAKTPAQPAN